MQSGRVFGNFNSQGQRPVFSSASLLQATSRSTSHTLATCPGAATISHERALLNFSATCRLWTPTLARHSPGLLCLTQCYQILFQPARFVAGIPPQMIHETQPHRHPPAASPSVPPASPANGTLKLRTDSSPVPPPECMHAEVMRYCGENA